MMKILRNGLCLFFIVFQQVFAAPNPLDEIASQALANISPSEQLKIENFGLHLQLAKQTRLNAEMQYKLIQLKEKVSILSSRVKATRSSSLNAKNKTLTERAETQQLARFENLSNNNQSKVNALEQQAAKDTSKILLLTTALSDAKQKNQAKIDAQNERYQSLNAQFAELKTTRDALKYSLNNIQQKRRALEQKNQMLLAEAKDTSKILLLTTALSDAKQKNQAKIDAQNERYQSLNAQFAELKTTRDALKYSLNNIQQKRRALEQENQMLLAEAKDKSIEASEDYQKVVTVEKDVGTKLNALADNAKDQFKLANNYRANQNYETALYWYLKVADKGYASAKFNVGHMYYHGLGVEKDVEQAFSFYLQSAKQGFVEAQYNVGLMYALGEGIGQDNEQSSIWYTRAAKQGHLQAQKVLDKIAQQKL